MVLGPPFVQLPPPLPPRMWLFLELRDGAPRHLRTLSEASPTVMRGLSWIPLGMSTSGPSLEEASARLLRRWQGLGYRGQADLLIAAVLEAIERGYVSSWQAMRLTGSGTGQLLEAMQRFG